MNSLSNVKQYFAEFPPTRGGSAVPPTAGGSAVSPTAGGSAVSPTAGGSAVPPTAGGSAVRDSNCLANEVNRSLRQFFAPPRNRLAPAPQKPSNQPCPQAGIMASAAVRLAVFPVSSAHREVDLEIANSIRPFRGLFERSECRRNGLVMRMKRFSLVGWSRLTAVLRPLMPILPGGMVSFIVFLQVTKFQVGAVEIFGGAAGTAAAGAGTGAGACACAGAVGTAARGTGG